MTKITWSNLSNGGLTWSLDNRLCIEKCQAVAKHVLGHLNYIPEDCHFGPSCSPKSDHNWAKNG